MEEGSGTDQGDQTPTPGQWPTEPDQDTSEPTPEAPASDHATVPADGGDDQLPTTSGTEAAAVVSLGLVAALIVVAGLVLLRRRRPRRHW